MHFAQLQTQQIRYHENIRPRYRNPTYQSTNVGGSLGVSMVKSHSTNTLKNHSALVHSSNEFQANQRNNLNSPKQSQSLSQSNNLSKNKLSYSSLSKYGTNSLGPMRKYIGDKEVYEKQQKKYNIVTIQPKQYVDSIKVYPKLRLQNSDQNFYKKLLIANEISFKKNNNNSQVFQSIIDKKIGLNPETSNHQNMINKPFRGKLLNNIDQLNGVL